MRRRDGWKQHFVARMSKATSGTESDTGPGFSLRSSGPPFVVPLRSPSEVYFHRIDNRWMYRYCVPTELDGRVQDARDGQLRCDDTCGFAWGMRDLSTARRCDVF